MTKRNEATDDDGVIKDGQTITVRMDMMDSASGDERLRAAGVEQLLKSGTLTDEQRAAFGRMPSNSALHAPGSLPTTDADRDRRSKLYEDRDHRLADAWKNAPPLDPAQTARAITPAPSADRYAARDSRLEQAWRSA